MDTLPPPPISLTPKLKRRYIRCAKGTRRQRKSHACRSVMHKKCAKGTRRSRKDGKCYANN